MRAIVLAGLLVAAAPVSASTPAVSCAGVVFVDADGDGEREAGEAGVAGVAVYDGAQLRRTDADGRFAFAWTGDGPGERTLLFVKPAGYTLPSRPDGLPAHWRRGPVRELCADLPLRPDHRIGPLNVLVFADPQTRDAREVGWYGTAIIDRVIAAHASYSRSADIPPRYGPGQAGDLGLTLGDVTNDDPSLYPALNAQTTRLGVPWLHAPGNHDIDLAAADDAASLASYTAVYGPDTLAWEENEVTFVLLDDVIWQPQSTPKYIGGLREDQFDFLAAYLATLPRDRLLVIGAHMPFFDDKPGTTTFRPADRERLFALLQPFEKLLLLSGHGHVQRRHDHDEATGWHGAAPLHEFNVGAACGSYWGGPAEADGVPVSTMADGTPKGWAELGILGDGRWFLEWHPAEATAAGAWMTLHAPRVLRRGSWPGFAVYANVFLGQDDTAVEYRIDGGDWQPMRRVERADPGVLAENARDDGADTLRAFDRLPEAVPSTHLWRGTLPTDLAAGAHPIEVRAFLNGRDSAPVYGRAEYRLEDATRPAPASAGTR